MTHLDPDPRHVEEVDEQRAWLERQAKRDVAILVGASILIAILAVVTIVTWPR